MTKIWCQMFHIPILKFHLWWKILHIRVRTYVVGMAKFCNLSILICWWRNEWIGGKVFFLLISSPNFVLMLDRLWETFPPPSLVLTFTDRIFPLLPGWLICNCEHASFALDKAELRRPDTHRERNSQSMTMGEMLLHISSHFKPNSFYKHFKKYVKYKLDTVEI